MSNIKTRSLSLLLALLLGLSLTTGAFAAEPKDAIADTSAFLLRSVPDARIGAIGGDWTVLALARGGASVPDRYYQNYYAAVAAKVRACSGMLDERKYTEYSRVILALSAIGKDARDVAGYDLTVPLGDFDKTVRQGLNGAIFALLALDSREYPMPENGAASTQATRQMYIDYILENCLPGGGWNFMCDADSEAEPDMTGMALQALAPYRDQEAVSAAIDAGLSRMSALQNDAGGFTSWGAPNLEGSAQMLVALCTLEVSVKDPRFVKNGNTLLDDLMGFYTQGKGFAHSADTTGADLMASEQALQGLIAVQRTADGQAPLLQMTDSLTFTARKHPDVKVPPVRDGQKAFPDIQEQERAAVEALAAHGIVSGMGDGYFHPQETMTRAQFAAITVQALGLAPKAGERFTDVPAERWYASYVGTAAEYGIIHGRGNGIFDPEGAITRQEAGIMLEQAAALAGAPELGSDLRGSEQITRGEMAQEIYALLQTADLL